MNIRQQYERLERENLQPWAVCSADSRGRQREEPACEMRTVFQRDRDRIIHSKEFRRLMHKTQVFISPEGDHYRTRLTHTLEVSQIARTIARSLRLNEDLVEAMALGHDLGHTPFGHAGERTLHKLNADYGGFRHYEQSLRVVDLLAKDGQGLNLTWEVRDGILHHSGSHEASTLEGRILKYADRIAYINHDIDDAVRGGVLQVEYLPRDLLRILGATHKERINTLISSVIRASQGQPVICMEPEIEQAMMELRSFLFRSVYTHEEVKLKEEEKAERVITTLFGYYLQHVTEMSNECIETAYREGAQRAVTDYIAGMTDRYAIKAFTDLCVPRSSILF
ncbi:MAG: deoxyguanosinetriphosphate triphosphohydrolase [Eubacteriales bacterium]|jgi:dGTPase